MFIKGLLLLLAASFLSAGKLLLQPETRIINGVTVDIEKAPWQVSLRLNRGPNCGGSIYSETIIITAAHCFYNKTDNTLYRVEQLEVLAGSANKFSTETVVKVAAIKPHQKYTHFTNGYDIGIVKLSAPLDLTTRKMQKIELAKHNPNPKTKAWVTGWGRSETGFYPDFLKSVHVYIQSCKTIYHHVSEDIICAGSPLSTTCDGDSGGPLVVGKTLVGVVSYGKEDCRTGTAYASVSYFRDWILKAVNSI